MSATDTIPSVTIVLERGENEHFEIILNADGTGIMHDVDYGERLDINHDISEDGFAGLIALAPNGETIDEESLSPEISSLVDATFDDNNELLENPVGDPPGDEELSIGNGTEHDFYRALAAMLYLANLNAIGQGSLSFSVDGEDDGEYDEVPAELQPLVDAICGAFEPSGSFSYEYVDQNDGRVTAYAKSSNNVSLETSDIETYLPSARERLEARRILTDLLSNFGARELVDSTFPTRTLQKDKE